MPIKFNIDRGKKVLGMILRYGITGFSGMGANLVVFSLLVKYTNLGLILIPFLSFVVAYVVTFSMHKYWTFKSLSKELFYKQSILYLFTSVATLLINIAGLYVLVTLASFPPVLAQFLSLLVAAGLSFLFTTQVTFHANESRIHFITGILKPPAWPRFVQQKMWLGAILIAIICVLIIFVYNDRNFFY